MSAPAGLLDTSVFIAQEGGRLFDAEGLPEQGFVGVVTLAELQAGVLAAKRTDDRARRLRTLEAVTAREPLPITAEVAGQWARLRVQLAQAGRKVPANDLWIAAIAATHDLPVVTQDAGFDALDEEGLLDVIQV